MTKKQKKKFKNYFLYVGKKVREKKTSEKNRKGDAF
jgi:hypothetical protein